MKLYSRKFISIIDYDESVASRFDEVNGMGDRAPGEVLESEFETISDSGLTLEDWAIVDDDVQWERYLKYLVEWVILHTGYDFEGYSPMCYGEWCDCEVVM